MGGFFGVVSKRKSIEDVYFGTDYHSHLGTRSAGIAAFGEQKGLQRVIHRISKFPFRAKFEHIFTDMEAVSAIGCINDNSPQPILIRSRNGVYAIAMVGIINNKDELVAEYLKHIFGQFEAYHGGEVIDAELVAALINQKNDIAKGIKFAQDKIEGSANIIILEADGSIVAARDKYGRMPLHVGRNGAEYTVAFENFSYQKLGYQDYKELGPGEIVRIKIKTGLEILKKPNKELKICSFLWTYYGYPTSQYEGVNVEAMRYRNGEILAKNDEATSDLKELDYVGGVPDSGTPHAIGYAQGSELAFTRPFIKYTPTWPRSFMPPNQVERNKVAKMKLIPVTELIEDKNLLLVDDSIVRGTQLRETVDFLYANGAKSVHCRSACPPIMYSCKYLNFSRGTDDMELITRRIIIELEGEEGLQYIDQYSDSKTERGQKMRQAICDKLQFASLEFQSLDGLIEAIGLPKCKLCTYCWNGCE